MAYIRFISRLANEGDYLNTFRSGIDIFVMTKIEDGTKSVVGRRVDLKLDAKQARAIAASLNNLADNADEHEDWLANRRNGENMEVYRARRAKERGR